MNPKTRVLRTPEERFANLPDFPYSPLYTYIDGLRIAHVEAGQAKAAPVLMLHGEPTWSFLYRKMIPIVADAGYRVLAPDLVGCGRSDKPVNKSDYTYKRHNYWITRWIELNDLKHITLVCQDWGSFIGLRIAVDNPQRFARIILANGALPTGEGFGSSILFRIWLAFSRFSPFFPVGGIVRFGCKTGLDKEVVAGYNAPFPGREYMTGVRVFPSLVPTDPNHPEAAENRKAWQSFQSWEKPFLTVFGDSDPFTRGIEHLFQESIPGANNQPHTTIKNAGHFLQEDKGEELARIVVDFMSGSADNSDNNSKS